MITPEEIKEQCNRCWKDVLKAGITGISFFPKEIQRIGKVKTKGIVSNVVKYSQSIEELRKHSKESLGYGYTVIWEERKFNKIGENRVPDKILLETLQDYLKLLNKEKEYKYFSEQSQLIISSTPQLKKWIIENPLKVIEHKYWSNTLKVCNYFLQNPKPDLYIRQLPIEIHTKFIKEENESLIGSLLDYLIPEYINEAESKFEKRYNLKYAEPLIRIRFLDKSLSFLDSISDLSTTLTEFNNSICDCKNILVTENIMNFLTLPDIPDTIALWSGGGFKISYFKNVEWLKNKQFYYWGDIDTHGFHILNQFRSYLPNTKTILMNEETLHDFKSHWGKGEITKNQELNNLTHDEITLYEFLKAKNVRLEQEKITQMYSEQKILLAINSL